MLQVPMFIEGDALGINCSETGYLLMGCMRTCMAGGRVQFKDDIQYGTRSLVGF